jgi:hypothetical protein
MAEYIPRTAALEICEMEYQGRLRMLDYCGDTVAWNIFHEIKALPPADVAPVVRCKDCEYSYDEISYLCCSHGVCVDCEVPPSFYCAYGKRRAEKEPPEEGEI